MGCCPTCHRDLQNGLHTGPLLLFCLLFLQVGCAPTETIRSEWAGKVDSGEYGWINYNDGETRNLDSYMQSPAQRLQNDLEPEYSARCLAQLRELAAEVSIEIHFLLSERGHPLRFLTISDRVRACSRDVIETMSTFSFRPGLRNGEPVITVGEYSLRLSAKSGY